MALLRAGIGMLRERSRCLRSVPLNDVLWRGVCERRRLAVHRRLHLMHVVFEFRKRDDHQGVRAKSWIISIR